MKILFVIHSLRSGGAEKVLSLLANDWRKKGHEITIAMNNTENTFHHIEDSIQILNIGLEQKGIAKEIIGNIKRIQKLKSTINAVNPDVTIAFMTSSCILTTIAARLTKKPLINSEHTNFFSLRSKPWRLLRRIIYPYADALIVLTSHDKAEYHFHENVHIIENPLIMTNNHKNLIREKIILVVGSLELVKGFDMALKAFSCLRKADEWKLIILGEGNERFNLEKQAKKLNIFEKVQFKGVVSDVEQYYKKASIFVLSSRSEGFPVALCEAMAYGCPPVAFNCLTGPSDIIDHDNNGLLVEPNNIEALSENLQNLIDNPKKREFLSKNAEKIKNRLNIDGISKEWFKVIQSTISNSKVN